MTSTENAGEIKCPICKRLTEVKLVVGGAGDLHTGYSLAIHGIIGRWGKIRKVCEGSGQMLMFYKPQEAADAAKQAESTGARGGDGDS